MIHQTANWVSKLRVQNQKYTSYKTKTWFAGHILPVQRHSKTSTGQGLFFRMFYGWEQFQQPLRQMKNQKDNISCHVNRLLQKKPSYVPTIESNISCCIPDPRAGTNDHRALVWKGQVVCRVKHETWHKKSTMVSKIHLFWEKMNYRQSHQLSTWHFSLENFSPLVLSN